jgi:galactokinase
MPMSPTTLLPGATVAWFVPGRIEVLGKHTDYAAGRSLLCAVDRGFSAAGRLNGTDTIAIRDADSSETVTLATTGPVAMPAMPWGRYPAVVVSRIIQNFPGTLRGCDIAFASNLPPAAGLSSSSALVIMTFQMLADLCGIHTGLDTPEELAGYLGAVENGRRYGPFAGDAGVGTSGGSQDHVAILCSRPDHLVRYSFAPVRFEGSIPMPAGHCFVIAASGVRAEKTGAAMDSYNNAAASTRSIVDRWNQSTGRSDATLADALASSPDAGDRLRLLLRDSPWLPRFEQFVDESTRIIPAAAAALAAGDLPEFGRLVDLSQAGAERGLGNQIAATIFLARSARGLGAAAASAFGAGFGGSVWAMVPTSDAGEFAKQWEGDYRSRFGHQPTFFRTSAAEPARRVDVKSPF